MKPASHWEQTRQASPLLCRQTASTESLLESMSQTFLKRVPLTLMDSLVLDSTQQRRIAAEACLPIVHLGLDWYDDVREILVYPSAFIVDHCWTDDDGIEHQARGELAGEAWDGGPVILAWDEIALSGTPGHESYNVVVHEFAHVIDARNGAVNGFPPIADATLARRWPTVFQNAYDTECEALERDEPTVMDDYATENPAEFFAVATETYFADPERLERHLPALFDCLRAFYGNGRPERAIRLF